MSRWCLVASLAACGDSGGGDATSAATTGTTQPGTGTETSADLPTSSATGDSGVVDTTAVDASSSSSSGTTTAASPTTGPETATSVATSEATTADPDTTGTSGAASTGTGTSGAPAECGNAVVEPGEACDDGNQFDGDGCDSACMVVPVLCGNATIDPGEGCDDGNADADDGCGSTCLSECGFLCLSAGEACIPGFHAVQCASPGAPFGQPSPVANDCRLATLSVDGSHIALSPPTTLGGQPQHLDAMFTDPSNAVFGFAGDTTDIDAGSRLVAVDTATGELTPVGPSLGLWVMGAAMNDSAELWVTVFDTYELNQNTAVRIAAVDPDTGQFVDGPDPLLAGNTPVTVYSTHVSDVAFRFDGAMFLSANDPGPPPPEPLSRYLEVDRDTATVVSSVAGPDDLYAAGIVFVGEAERIIAMDIRGVDDIFILDLAAPPDLNETLLYPDPIPTNSGTADLAGCAKLEPQ
ncbi:MAG: hypothetical protein JNL82_24130 [Myxococcales bacterium]|nr:hypothetical protein [Myxococcales bacterium]